jgi:hypothetical protein
MVFAIAGLGKWVGEGGVLERRRLRALSRVGKPRFRGSPVSSFTPSMG